MKIQAAKPMGNDFPVEGFEILWNAASFVTKWAPASLLVLGLLAIHRGEVLLSFIALLAGAGIFSCYLLVGGLIMALNECVDFHHPARVRRMGNSDD